MQDANGIGYTIGIVVVMVAVLMATYFVSQFVASKYKRYASSKYMKVLDQLYITKDKAIVMVEIGDKNVILGVTNQSINMLSEVDKEDVVPIEYDASPIVDIGKKFTDYFKRKSAPKKEPDFGEQNDKFKSIFDSIDKQKNKFDKYYAKDEDEDEKV